MSNAERIVEALVSFHAGGTNPTRYDLEDYTGLSWRSVNWSISQARKTICRDLGLAISCTMDDNGEYRYRLTDLWVSGSDDPDIRAWEVRRMERVTTQLENMYHAIEVAAALLDKRTKIGRKAQRAKVHVGRLLEDMADINEDGMLT